MDFTGKGFITEDDFLSSIVISRILTAKAFILDDISEFFKQEQLFSSGGLGFDKFKKLFFPKLFLIDESEESEEERQMKKNQQVLQVGISDSQDSEA
jgi:hypothetical protein